MDKLPRWVGIWLSIDVGQCKILKIFGVSGFQVQCGGKKIIKIFFKEIQQKKFK